MKKKSAYIRVYDEIKARIIDNVYPVGALLPSEPELEKLFGVSRTTVRKAVELLAGDGFIVVKQGFGTQIVSRKITQNLNKLTSISQSLQSKGYSIGVKNTYIERLKADEALAEAFQVPVGTGLVCIYRVQLADNKPVSIARNYILAELVTGIEKYSEQIVSVYKLLSERYNIVYSKAKDVISACSASFEEASILETEPKTALLYVKRSCYLQDRICEIDIVKLLADKYEFEVYMTI